MPYTKFRVSNVARNMILFIFGLSKSPNNINNTILNTKLHRISENLNVTVSYKHIYTFYPNNSKTNSYLENTMITHDLITS